MNRLVPALVALLAAPVAAQPTIAPLVPATDAFRILDADGRPSSFEALLDAVVAADVVFLGEMHDDSVAHALQLRVLQQAHARVGDRRPVAVAFEMFERDVQGVLDEYLAGLVREQDFLAAARPWGNYPTDYAPILEYARAHGLPVVASNAPGRYVARVGREGMGSLDALPATGRLWLPPRPLAPPSDALAAKFTAAMGGMAAHGGGMSPHGPMNPHAVAPSLQNTLAAQNLRDATMAFSLAEALAARPGALVLHVNGAFHSDSRLGIPEHLARLRPDARVLVVSMRPTPDADEAPARGDFTVLTGSSGPSE